MSDDEGTQELMASLVGRTITRTFYERSESGTGDDCWIYLDDGRVISFTGWGHDWWGTEVEVAEVVDVEACLHCGERHRDRLVFDGMAYCTDGNSTAWRSPTPPA